MPPTDWTKILVCPACKSAIKVFPDFLVCTNIDCRKKYRIDNKIPVMLTDESPVLELTEHQKLLNS